MFSLINNNFTSTDIINNNNCLDYDSNTDTGFVTYKITDTKTNTVSTKYFKKINHDAKADIGNFDYNLKMTGFIVNKANSQFIFRLTTTGPTSVYFNFSPNIIFNQTSESQTTTLSKKFATIKKDMYIFYIEKTVKSSYTTTSFNLEYSTDNGTNWKSIDTLVLNCANNTLDNSYYSNLFLIGRNNKINSTNIRDSKSQKFYENIEQYVLPNYTKPNSLAIVDGQYDDWSSYEQWTPAQCGRKFKKSTRNYLPAENGGLEIEVGQRELERYQDEICQSDYDINYMWKTDISCVKDMPSEINIDDLKYTEGTASLKTKLSKWVTHDNATVSKQCFDSKITSGTTIKKGQRVYSPNNSYYLSYQTDNNIILYNSSNSSIWSSDTSGKISTNLTFKDGNLILYNGSTIVWQTGKLSYADAYLEINNDGRMYIKTSDGKFISYYGTKFTSWSQFTIMKSSTDNPYGTFKLYSNNYYFTYQPDGNLVVYNNSNSALWASDTGGKTHTHLTLKDGNLILYNDTTAVWQTGPTIYTDSYMELDNDGRFFIKTSDGKFIYYNDKIKLKEWTNITIAKQSTQNAYGSFKLYGDDGYFTYQPDGNLVIYNNNNSALWSSGTSGKTHTHLTLQSDGNLVLYNGSSSIWNSNTSVNKALKLKMFKTYLLLLDGNNIVKIINSPGDSEFLAYYIKNTLYDASNAVPTFIARNIDATFWRVPKAYFYKNSDESYTNNCGSIPFCGGTSRGKSGKTIVNGKSWDWENSLFTNYMKKVDNRSYKWDANSSDAPPRLCERNVTYWETNGNIYYDDNGTRIDNKSFSDKTHLRRIQTDPGLPGYRRISDTGDGTDNAPYLIAWDSRSSHYSNAYSVFQVKSKDDFTNEVKNNNDTLNWFKGNPDNIYYDSIIKYIGASGTYGVSNFRSGFRNKDGFRNRKEGLGENLCNIEDIFNDTNCNGDLTKAYKDYLGSMDNYCINDNHLMSHDCISYLNTSFTDSNGNIVYPNKFNKNKLIPSYISKCRNNNCRLECSSYPNSRFKTEVCDMAELEDQREAKRIQDANDARIAAEKKLADEKATADAKFYNQLYGGIAGLFILILIFIFLFKRKQTSTKTTKRSNVEGPRGERLTRQQRFPPGMIIQKGSTY